MSGKDNKVYIELRGKTYNYDADLKRMQSRTHKAVSGMEKNFNRLQKAAGAIFAVGAAANLIKSVTALGAAQIKAEAKVRNAVKTTSSAAGKTTAEIKRMASELQSITGIGDETILSSVQAQLLTFTKIRGGIFDELTKLTLDINQVVNDGSLSSLTSLSIQLGKALNDPVANLGALGRMGVQFDKAQKETVRGLVNSNRLYDAQSIILKELNRQYGGQAAAAAKAMGGAKQLSAAWSDYAEVFGLGILSVFTNMAGGVKEATKLIEDQTRRAREFFGIVDIDAEKEKMEQWTSGWIGSIKDVSKVFAKSELQRLKTQKSINDLEIATIEANDVILKQSAGLVGVLTSLATKDTDRIKELEDQNKQINIQEGLYKKILKNEKIEKGTNGGKKAFDNILSGSFVAIGSVNDLKTRVQELGKTLENTSEPKTIIALNRQLSIVKQNLSDLKINMIGLEIDANGLDVSGLPVMGEVSTDISLPSSLGNAKEATKGTGYRSEYLDSLNEEINIWGNLADAQSQAMGSLVAGWASQIKLFEQANSMLQQFLETLLQVAAQQLAMLAIGSFGGGGLLGIVGGLFAHEGGTFQGGKKIASFASGGDFIVPSGYSNDSFPMMVESGERVTVTPTSKVGLSDKALVSEMRAVRDSIQAMNMNLVSKNMAPIVNVGINSDSLVKNSIKPSEKRLANSGVKLD